MTKNTLTLFAAALLGTASAARAGGALPDFSWERVPLYAHVGLGRGRTDDQYRFLAEHYGFIAFTGGEMDREYRRDPDITFEDIVTDAAAKVKARNPRAKVLFYLAGDFPKPHLKRANAGIPGGGLLEVKVNAKSTHQVFDTTRQDVREWWAGVAEKAVNEYGCDGLFVDGGTAFRPGHTYERMLGSAKREALEAGMSAMIRQAKERMGPESLLILNPLHGFQGGEKMDDALGWRYLSLYDGAMIDDFDRAANVMSKRQTPAYIANTIRVMAEAAKQGEIVIFKAWPGFTWWSDPELMKEPRAAQHAVAKKNLEFYLACFLAGAEENCYFCYTWGWLPEHGAFDWYPEFDKPLGAPKGEAAREGWILRREFEHASVFVDIQKRTAEITWK